jgi:pectate lyase
MRRGSSKSAYWALALGASMGCSSAPRTLPPAQGSTNRTPPTYGERPVGWASVPDLGVNGTSGGEGGEVLEVSTTADFLSAIEGDSPRIVIVSGSVGDGGRATIGSNKTVMGRTGAEFRGGLRVNGGFNIILRNLKIVGNNCKDGETTDAAGVTTTDCSAGSDAFNIGNGAHHVWVDHCDVSDGSDGNLDVNGAADYVSISWTKFWYTGRAGGHQFSNLVGSSDTATADAGHLRVTFHNNWWADGIRERMPRVRFGQVHVFSNLYTSSGNNYCIRAGAFANLLVEENAFIGVSDPVDLGESNAQTVVVSRNNLYLSTQGTAADKGTEVFAPPYSYTPDDANVVEQLIRDGAGLCPSDFVFSPLPTPTCTLDPESS